MTTAWVHLPNAVLIDEVLTSLKAHPEKWAMAQAASRSAARDAARSAARSAARIAARIAAWYAAWYAAQTAAQTAARIAARIAAWDAAQDAAWDAAWGAAWDAAWDAVAALIAYDDASQFMKLPVEQLKAMYRLDPHPMYLLLQPAAVVFVEGMQ